MSRDWRLYLADVVEYQDIAGFRDWLAHGYWGVRQDVVWSVLSGDLPRLRDAAATLLAEADRADPPPA